MGVPVLKADFFQHCPPSREFFEKWKDSHPWSEKLIPLYEWDQLLFVGCLQEPIAGPAGIQVVFVIAGAEGMKQTWARWHTADTTADAPGVLDNSDVQIPIIAKANIPSFAPQTSKAPPAPPPPAAEEASFDKMEADTAIVAAAATTSEDSPEGMEGLSLQTPAGAAAPNEDADPFASLEVNKIPSAKPSADEGFQPDSLGETTPSPVEAKESDEAGQLEGLELPTEAAPAAKTAPPPTPPKVAAPLTRMTNNPLPKPGEVPTPKAAPAAPPPTPLQPTKAGAKLTPTTAASANDGGADTDPWADKILHQMDAHYLKSMILIFDGQYFKPWKWHNFQKRAGPMGTYSVEFLSPFRVVNRTLHSYHGLTVPNEIMEHFYEEWNGAQTPEVLTMSPLADGETLMGVIIGLGSSSAYNKNSLSACEKLASEASTIMKAKLKKVA